MIGPGRAGISLARLLQGVGWTLTGVHGGSGRGGATVRDVLGVTWSPAVATEDADLVLLTVPDDALEAIGRTLEGGAAGRTFLHASGLHGISVLEGIHRAGGRVVAFHPLRSFPVAGAAKDLGGALVAIEASDPATQDEFERLARLLQGVPFRLPGASRSLYHLGAATMGNAVLAVAVFAEAALRAAGVPEPLIRPGLGNLARGALENYEVLGAAHALTGPLIRGDVAVLARHRRAVDDQLPQFAALHQALLEALCRIDGVPAASRDHVRETRP